MVNDIMHVDTLYVNTYHTYMGVCQSRIWIAACVSFHGQYAHAVYVDQRVVARQILHKTHKVMSNQMGHIIL